MLPRKRGNPDIVSGDRAAFTFQDVADRGILDRGSLVDGQYARSGDHFGKPPLVMNPVA